MEIQGAALLYALAGLMVTFAGFAALLLGIRQAAGARLATIDRFLAKTTLINLFTLAAASLLPPLLRLYGLSEIIVWKIAASIFAPIMLAILISYPARRKRVVGKYPPPIISAVFVSFGGLAVGVMFIAVIMVSKFSAAAYASALFVNLFTTAFAFITALDVVMQQPMASPKG